MLASTDTVILGLGDSYMQGSEAGQQCNSFLNQYCDLKGFDCVNLGHEAIGNMGSVLKALVYDIDWSQWKNKYLFWMPTGLNRFDMANKQWRPNDYHQDVSNAPFFTPFPSEQPHDFGDEKRKQLEAALAHFTTPQTGRQDFLTAYQIIKNFYDVKGFNRMFIFPAFSEDTTYYQMKFLRWTDTNKGIYKINDSLFNRMGWKHYIEVDGCKHYYQWLCKQAGLNLNTSPHTTMETYKNNLRNEEVEKWIAPRSHATQKANIVFARRLQEVLDI